VRAFAIGVEGADSMTIQRLQSADARELYRPAVFGRLRQHLSRRQDSRHIVVGLVNGLAEMGDSVAQRPA
jgi:hypothetical protein